MNVEQELQKALSYALEHTREETEVYLIKELEKCEYGSDEYNEWLEILNHVLNNW